MLPKHSDSNHLQKNTAAIYANTHFGHCKYFIYTADELRQLTDSHNQPLSQDKSKTLLGLGEGAKKTPSDHLSCPNSLTYDKEKHEYRINQQYMGDSIQQALSECKFLNVRSEKGTGKTSALRKIITDIGSDGAILIVTPRKRLNYAMAGELGLNYYEHVKNEIDAGKRGEMAKRMVTTPQSLNAILAEYPSIKYDLIAFDESESIASMLVSKVTKQKEKTLATLKAASKNASHVVAMDADLGQKTSALMLSLGNGEKSETLINEFKRWKNITAQLITGGKYDDRTKAINSLIVDSIEKGERIGISSSSKEYCNQIHHTLKTKFPEKSICLITSESTRDTQKLLDNPRTAAEYDILIFSPAVNVGVSFDLKDHFHKVYGVYPNNEGTGTTDDATQGLARIRHPIDNSWIVVLDDDKQVFSAGGESLMPNEISKILIDSHLKNSFYSSQSVTMDATKKEIATIYAECEHYKQTNKNNFTRNFISSLQESGITIEEINIGQVAVNDEAEELREEAKQTKKEELIAAKTTSLRIDEETYNYIRAIMKFKPDEATQSQRDSVERYIFERNYSINCDDLDQTELAKYLELDDNDTIAKLVNREIALSGDDFTKEYMRARIAGIDETEAFRVDLIDEKLNYRLKKKLMGYATPYFDGEEYSNDSLKGSAFFKFLERHRKEIIVRNVLNLPATWRQNPAKVMSKLLEMQGYGHKSKRIRNGKKRVYIYSATTNPAVEQVAQQRQETGKDWITRTKQLMGLYQAPAKQPEPKTRLERLWHESGRSDDIAAFMDDFKHDIADIEGGYFPDETMLKVIAGWQMQAC